MVVSASVLMIGFVFRLGAASDPAGKLRTPGVGSIFCFAAVAGAAAFPLYAGSPRSSRRAPPPCLGQRWKK
jgi:hypothetical protein